MRCFCYLSTAKFQIRFCQMIESLYAHFSFEWFDYEHISLNKIGIRSVIIHIHLPSEKIMEKKETSIHTHKHTINLKREKKEHVT